MTLRIGSIIAWLCAILVSAFTLMSAIFGILLSGQPDAIKMAGQLGITGMEVPLGITKIIIILLYLVPRTSTIGFVLMIGYYGGVLATNITHGFTMAEMTLIYVVFVLLTVSAYFRNPELLSRLLKRPL